MLSDTWVVGHMAIWMDTTTTPPSPCLVFTYLAIHKFAKERNCHVDKNKACLIYFWHTDMPHVSST